MGQALVEVVEQKKQEDQEKQEEPVPCYPATVTVEAEEVASHDFTSCPLVCVGVELRLVAREEGVEGEGVGGRRKKEAVTGGGILVQYQHQKQERGARVGGHTQVRSCF